MDTHTYIYEPKNTNLHERELLRRLRGFDSCQFFLSWMVKSSPVSDHPTCPSSPCCGQASFALGKNSTAGPVLQHYFNSTFRRINSIFLSQHFNISISISQISAKRTGPNDGRCLKTLLKLQRKNAGSLWCRQAALMRSSL
jgi:hypothetical protein